MASGDDPGVEELPTPAVEAVELVPVPLRLRRPFTTHGGTVDRRPVLLVRLRTDLGEGWGECVALPAPTYTSEWQAGAQLVIEDVLAPRLVAAGPLAPAAVAPVLGEVVGHPMAKAALETAVLDAALRAAGRSFAAWSGSARAAVPVAAALGLDAGDAQLADRATALVEAGYRHLKLKVEPGRSLGPVRVVRGAVGEHVALRVDANGSFAPDGSRDELRALDDLGLELIEQPYPAAALVATARLARELATPVCLDESVASLADLEVALALGAAVVLNVKPGRVGGPLAALALLERCRAEGVAAWIGGMLESGVGRGLAVALAAHPGCTLPGDTAASDHYWADDLTEPFVLRDGSLAVPDRPGVARPDPERLARALQG